MTRNPDPETSLPRVEILNQVQDDIYGVRDDKILDSRLRGNDNILVMAHTKAAGSTKLGRDSQPQYLGVKLFAGQPANIGSIIVRQRGTKFVAGKNVRRASDDTLYSLAKGIVKFTAKKITNFTGAKQVKKVVNVIATTK